MTSILTHPGAIRIPTEQIAAYVGLVLSVTVIALVIVLPISIGEVEEGAVDGAHPIVLNDFRAWEER